MAEIVSNRVNTTSKISNKKQTSNLLLGRFEIGKLLGQGNFAKVYYATNIKTGEEVAIKVIDKEKILKGGLVAHIKREISIMHRVRHPNIVQLFEVMATKSKIYFVMEYVRGGELFNKVSKGRLKEEVARKYFQQLISAVEFCHARGVYHRDIKPENLLVDENGNLKVSDFGLSAVSDQIRQDELFHTFCGTPAYVAPEVLSRRGYDGAKVDIWSCGVVLFVLMAGYLPFNDKNIMAMYRRIYRGDFRCPRWFSPHLSKFLALLLVTNPEARIGIPEIMGNKWFKKGFKQIKFYVEDDRLCNVDDSLLDNEDDVASVVSDNSVSESDSEIESKRRNGPLPRPASLNAFDIISFSKGFDLSGLFEEKGDVVRFVTSVSVSKIMSKLEEIAHLFSFSVRKKDYRVSLEGTRESVKGPLTIAVEIFELTPLLVVVEVKKKGGDIAEYEKFCTTELKPGLQNLMVEEYATSSYSAAPTQPHPLLRVRTVPAHLSSEIGSPHFIPSDTESPHYIPSDNESPHYMPSDSESPHYMPSDNESPHYMPSDSEP
ncbi:hypothetical protein TanjilG_11424 [Lupinus angustifolius]|uniref:non-specific serine/threonine protein kinase n=1 Tax=Lupinus angustifolius TaxID=3871 RepID=A0A1J7HMJ1_LUPAN|nr:PREDICTED: CBL-interacting serine/threonine-protein kinase 12-like [Lupinus angustifolius]OIW14079.1 hypothetical protein TanjilG_11424 [Lupinus angustifolius]